MALIKCSECGKEFSDKASACPNCACPVDMVERSQEKIVVKEKRQETISKEIKNNKDEIEICRTIIDKNKINTIRIAIISVLVLFNLMLLVIARNSDSDSNIGGLIFVEILALIPFIIVIFNNYKRNNIVLTNKRIKGTIYRLFSSANIDIPIDKINAIFTTNNFGISGISINSSFVRTYHLSFIQNAEEFREKTMEMIDSIK